MNTEVWKWILIEAPSEDLILISKILKFRFPGFRDSVWVQHISTLRPQMLKRLMTKQALVAVRKFYEEQVSGDESLTAVRESSEEELLAKIEQGLPLRQVLLCLLTDSEPAAEQKVLALFHQMEAKATGLTQATEVAPTTTGETPESAAQSEAKLNSIPLMQAKIAWLTEKLAKAEKQSEESANALRTAVRSHEKAEKQWNKEKQTLLKQLKAGTEALEQATAQALAAASLTEPAGPQSTSRFVGRMKRLVVGDFPPSARNVLSRIAGTEFSFCSSADAAEAWANIDLQEIAAVLVLKPATPLPTQRLIKRLVPCEKLVCCETQEELVSALGRKV